MFPRRNNDQGTDIQMKESKSVEQLKIAFFLNDSYCWNAVKYPNTH